MNRIAISVACFLAFFEPILAQKGFKTTSVVLFKNNLAFVTKAGSLETPKGEATFRGDLPDALHGAFWFTEPDLAAVQSRVDSVWKRQPLASMEDFVRANRGRAANFLLAKGDETWPLAGQIDTCFEQFFQLKTENGWRAVPFSLVQDVALAEQPATDRAVRQPQNALTLRFKNQKASRSVGLMYLRGQVGWTPEYLIELLDEKTARVTLRGLASNDSDEDFLAADLLFAIGAPNFRFADRPSPLVLSKRAQEIFARQDFNFRGNHFRPELSNAIISQTALYSNEGQNTAAPTDGEGEKQHDLFFFEVKNVSLRRGERAAFVLAETVLPIEHLHRIQLNKTDESQRNSSIYHSNNGADRGFEQKLTAAHWLKIQNKTTSPLTTSPALIVEKGRPLGQDLLRYAPAGGTGEMFVTTAPDVQAEEVFVEVSRKPKAHEWRGHFYDVVQIKGTITLKNSKNEPIRAEIFKTIVGRMGKSNEKWTIQNAKNLSVYPNSHNDISWKIDLRAGEERVIEYEYDVLVNWY